MLNLIIITRQFPYGKSETFLESEILILSKYFKNIKIYPSTSSHEIRDLPSNVFVDNLIFKDYENKFKWCLKTILTLHFYRMFLENFSHILSWKKLKAFFKYLVSYTIYNNKVATISENSQGLIYSYWYNAFVDSFCNYNSFNRKIVTRVHRGDLYEEISELGFFPRRQINISKIDRIFSISDDGYNYLSKKYNINNVSISKLGVQDNNFIAKKSHLNKFSIVSVSNVIAVKNVDLIARVIKKFSIDNPDIEIVWNHFGDGDTLPKIKKDMYKENVENLKCVFHGRVSNTEIFEFYSNNSVDILINLSSSEGIPVSMMEAISVGIPILATNVGGVSEIVNEKTGVLIDLETDEDTISNHLKEIFDSPKNRLEIRDYWLKNYSANINYKTFAEELILLS